MLIPPSPYAPFSEIPPEIFLNILSHVDSDDHLSVKLVSRTFHAYGNAALRHIESRPRNLAFLCRCHTNIEASLPRGRPLNCCICTHCGHVLPTSFFTDTQARKDNPKRICISCGIIQKKYTEKLLPCVKGEYLIPCWGCRKAVPQFKHWRHVLSLARHRYRLPDMTDVNEIYSVRYGAYCQGCLEERIGYPIARLYAEIAARSAARRGGVMVGEEKVCLKGVILHGVTFGNGPGFFKL